MTAINDYESVIGLEVHVQLDTASKIFCGCPTVFGTEPNRNSCPVCLGMPGSLPVLNERVLELGIRVGHALDCQISERVKFDRKNYFYPDLPKAYQISQYDMPVNGPGFLTIELKDADGQMIERKIRILRAHLEEDAGKLLHEGIEGATLVDYNRAGIPLLEIVSEPDLRSADEAYAYLISLKAILQYLEVSDCNMEEGSLRCDANVSVRKKGETRLGTKAEIKNLNSFKAVHKSIQYEIERQVNLVENQEKVIQETRLWNDVKGQTFTMRSKEEAHDYRYFPEPDLVPFTISNEMKEKLRSTLPELPRQRSKRFQEKFGLSAYDAAVLVEECLKAGVPAKLTSNWLQSELMALLNEKKTTLKKSPVGPAALAGLVSLIDKQTISGKIAKDVLPIMFETGKSAEAIVKEKGLVQVTDTKQIEEVVERVIAANPKSVEDFRSGKTQALSFLVGQIMKETKGKANPQLANQILEQKLK